MLRNMTHVIPSWSNSLPHWTLLHALRVSVVTFHCQNTFTVPAASKTKNSRSREESPGHQIKIYIGSLGQSPSIQCTTTERFNDVNSTLLRKFCCHLSQSVLPSEIRTPLLTRKSSIYVVLTQALNTHDSRSVSAVHNMPSPHVQSSFALPHETHYCSA